MRSTKRFPGIRIPGYMKSEYLFGGIGIGGKMETPNQKAPHYGGLEFQLPKDCWKLYAKSSFKITGSTTKVRFSYRDRM